MVDLVTYVDKMQKWGRRLETPSFEIGFGGKAANRAIAATKLGSQAMIVSKLAMIYLQTIPSPILRNMALIRNTDNARTLCHKVI